LGEYNQCQSQLKQLYKEGLPGSVDEFTAYRILYCIHTKNRLGNFRRKEYVLYYKNEYTNIIEMTSLLAELSKEQKEQAAIHHALLIRSAVALTDYQALFRLYKTCPNAGAYLMNHFIERERFHALKIICRA
jgi:hypothetical protein